MSRKKRLRTGEKTKKESSIKGEIIALLACVLLLMMGFAFIKNGIELISYQNTFTAETEGIIVSDVTTQRKKKGAGFGYSREFTAKYSYEYNGITYTDTLESAKKIEKGQVLKIRCKPDDPKDNYVKEYDTSGIVFMIIVGIIWDALFLLIIYCIFISIKGKKNKADLKESGLS